MRLIIAIAIVFFAHYTWAQENQPDSSRLLQEVVVEAYETGRALNEVPASVGIVKAPDLERFSNTSILPAVNLIPGVRMEERSPGSYRFSIRGSSLRSPFGVRNVKVYWNGLPFTDGGGNTYLNLLDFGAIGSIEVIKGPGGSLYGAGTGGVLLMKSPDVKNDLIQGNAVFGSYGLQRYMIRGQIRNDNDFMASVQLAHHKSDGYRQQSALKRNAANADLRFRAGDKGTLSTTLIFSNLFYETPGGLTKAQYDATPHLARPPSANLGAVEAKAAVTNETIFGGAVYDYDWNNLWTSSLGVYGGYSTFSNPTIRNFESRDETNFGLRTHTVYTMMPNQSSIGGRMTFGGEYQYFFSPIGVYGNVSGKADTVQVRDEVKSQAGLIFAQADIELPGDVFITAGASINFLAYDYVSIEPSPVTAQTRNFDAVVSPRLAVLKKFSEAFAAFASYSDGFSPPSLAEVRPSTNTFSKSLKPESGNNLELGFRGAIADRRFKYDVVFYDFRLRNTIVLRRDASEADYFVNAGKTSQRGFEAMTSFDALQNGGVVSGLKFWASFAYQDYTFKEYVVVSEDFSGNRLTGIPVNMLSGGVDFSVKKKFIGNLTANYVDEIPMNDANSVFADDYFLLAFRGAWRTSLSGHGLEIFAGIDNALDAKYSLGNDLNAFIPPGANPVVAGRYYNAAMPRNYYAGLSLTLASEN